MASTRSDGAPPRSEPATGDERGEKAEEGDDFERRPRKNKVQEPHHPHGAAARPDEVAGIDKVQALAVMAEREPDAARREGEGQTQEKIDPA